MESPERTPGGFSWSRYRYRKTIVPHKPGIPSPAVVRVSAQNNEDAWRENILRFINALRNSGKLKDLNQIAFLFRSVKFADVQALSDYLEENGVPVYSPRSDITRDLVCTSYYRMPDIALPELFQQSGGA